MRSRRLLLLSLSVLLCIILANALLAPRQPAVTGDGGGDSVTTPDASPDAAGTPDERALRAPGDIVHTLSARRTDQRIRVQVGDVVRIRVRVREPAIVQLGEDGAIEAADVGTPAEFELLVEEGLAAPVMLLDPPREIGRVVARP